MGDRVLLMNKKLLPLISRGEDRVPQACLFLRQIKFYTKVLFAFAAAQESPGIAFPISIEEVAAGEGALQHG